VPDSFISFFFLIKDTHFDKRIHIQHPVVCDKLCKKKYFSDHDDNAMLNSGPKGPSNGILHQRNVAFEKYNFL